MIKVLAIDDEELVLKSLVDSIKETIHEVEIFAFQKVSELLKFNQIINCSIAFIDINMPEINGIFLAKRLKEINQSLNIIFVTGYSEYAIESYNIRASGYVMKPISTDDLRKEIDNLRYPIQIKNTSRVRVKTFGNFEVFVDDKLLVFSRNTCKEIFAYLVDRNGTSATYAEIASIIWEDGTYDRSRQKQLYVRISEMIKTFEEVNIKDVIIKNRVGLMIDSSKIDCDSYRFLCGDVSVINSYRGEYMNSYSWAEFTNAYLYKKMTNS